LILVRAQESVNGITFPVAELGSCANKEECRAYCDDPAHMDSCISFAEAHGLMNKEEAARAESFRKKLGVGGGPGGCRSPRECEAFCGNVANLDVCIAFAEEQGFSDPHIGEAKRIQKYIQTGGAMPGGCDSRGSCEAYCRDFSHAEECSAFLKQAGIEDGRPGAGGPEREHYEKLLEFMKRGETPGGCTSKEACEAYCHEKSHFDECVAFGEKVGFIASGQAERMRQLGGKGPGGCDSPEACKAYCSDQTHREECYRFAEENGFIPPEEIQRAKEGFVQLKVGLDQAPPEVAACLKSVLGPTVIEDIQAGKLVPGPEIGERVRGCFEKFGRHRDFANPFQNAPPEVLSCLREKLGSSFEGVRTGEAAPTPEMADAFRVCFEGMRVLERGPGIGELGAVGEPGMHMEGFLRSAPPGIISCLRERIGDQFEKVQSGEVKLGLEMEQAMRGCFESFRPEMEGSSMQNPTVSGDSAELLPPESGERLFGYYVKVERTGWGGVTCDALVVTGGSHRLIRYFLDLVNRGNTVNSKNDLNQPVINLDLVKLEEKVREYLVSSSREHPAQLLVRQKPESAKDAPSCYSFVELIQITPSQSGGGGDGGFVPPSIEPVRPRSITPGSPPPNLSGPNFPPAVGECLRTHLGEADLKALTQGSQPSPAVEEAIRKCFSQTVPPSAEIQVQPVPAYPEQQRTVPSSYAEPQSLLGTIAAPFLELLLR